MLEQKPEQAEEWNFLSKLAFRFLFLFISLFVTFLFLRWLIDPLLAWMGESIFGLSENLSRVSSGSGDRTMDYLAVFLQAILAVTGTIAWSLIGRRRSSHRKLRFWFMSLLRLFVAAVMLVYGFAKVFLIQFQTPSLTLLVQQVGEMSPMGLAWTFMGFNPVYTIFTGLLEVFAGLFLIFRRTKTLGALLTLGVMGHVAVMNLCFDIPVKIFSLHLVLMSLVLLSEDWRSLSHVFFGSNRALPKIKYHALQHTAVYQNIGKIKGIFTALFLFFITFVGFFILKPKIDRQQQRDRFYGIYEISEFKKNGNIDQLNADQVWRYSIIEQKDKANIKFKDSVSPYYFILKENDKKATIYHKDSDSIAPNFTFQKLDNVTYKLKGKIEQDSLEFKMQRFDLKRFPLISRGFRWVNETPYNR